MPTDPAWGVRQWSFARLLAWKPPKPRLTWFDAAPLNFISGRPASDFQAVGGNYTGTTDMILRWAGCKRGMDENQLRARPDDESWWRAAQPSPGYWICA